MRAKVRTAAVFACLVGCVTVSSMQTGIAGRWRSILLLQNGDTREWNVELDATGPVVSGRAMRRPIRDGRIDGNTLSFKTDGLDDPTREASLTGTVSGDEIVFRSTGLVSGPTTFVARRDTRVPLAGSVSDPAVVHALMQQVNVPGVSIAIIQDFKVVATFAYGVADKATGRLVAPNMLFQAASISKAIAAMASLKAVQDKRFTLDQDINTILKSWKLPGDGFTNDRPVTPRTLLSHTAGLGDGFGFLGYSPDATLPMPIQILDALPPVPSGQKPVRLVRPPSTAYQYSGGGTLVQQVALTDAVGKPFEQIAHEWVFEPIGMTRSTFQHPLPPALDELAARGHGPRGNRARIAWPVYAAPAAAGLWTTPTDLARFAIEVQLSLQGRSNRVLSEAMVREMITPVGVGPWGLGFQLSRFGEGWYFIHTGSGWGYHCELVAHRLKGYGAVIMTNGDGGVPLLRQLRRLIQQEYRWDALDHPV